MIEILLYGVLLLLGFFLIIKSADYFVDEASAIGHKFGMSKILIGLTIVAVGTSLPELFTSIISFFFTPNFSDFVMGTIMGSNISNILLIMGIFLLFSKDFILKKRESLSIVFQIIVTLVLVIFALLGFVNFIVLLLIPAYIIYMYFTYKNDKKIIKNLEEEIEVKEVKSIIPSTIVLIFSIIVLVLATKLIVDSIEALGYLLSIPNAYLTLTTIALASSLPELAVTVNTAKKKEYLIGIGNIIGSNIMNIAIIFGLSGLFGYYTIQTGLYIYSIIFILLATALFSFALITKKFKRVYGFVLVSLYLFYLVTFFL